MISVPSVRSAGNLGDRPHVRVARQIPDGPAAAREFYGLVGRCISFGGSEASRGRNVGKRPSALQAEGPAGGHHQRGQETLFLLEAG